MSAWRPSSPSRSVDSRNRGGAAHVGVKSNVQRPEAIESIFYMYRKTGDEMYREWAWRIFQAFQTLSLIHI